MDDNMSNTYENLTFELKWVSKDNFSKLIKIADYIGRKSGKSVYMINPQKCKLLSPSQFALILSALKSVLPPHIIEYLSDLRESIIRITLDGSDLVIKGLDKNASRLLSPYVRYDSKNNVYRAMPLFFKNIKDILSENGYKLKYNFPEWSLSEKPKPNFRLRKYQKEAYDAWISNDMRGVIALPTGAGKTHIALWAIAKIQERTLIVIPTIDLLNQWYDKIVTELGLTDVGLFGGGDRDIRSITITTYSSAYLNAELFADKFGFVVFDEVHHLPSPKYRIIAESLVAWKRMGLSATPEREDNLHLDLLQLVGPVVYRKTPSELKKQRHIAEFEVKRIAVPLDSEQRKEYKLLMQKYREALHMLGIPYSGKKALELLIMRSGKSKLAHDAIVWREKARKIALNSEAKIKLLEEILIANRRRKTLIFTKYTSIVNRISHTFGIPKITHKTKREERIKILDAFRKGKISKIVTSEVLDEGTDVPDANLGIIVSGTGSKRQFIQRLGRLLRPKDEPALLIELVTKGTIDSSLSSRRVKALE